MTSTEPPADECPIARTMHCVGEWWSILILRDAFQGLTRFDEFQKSLGIASNILARRLKHMTEIGLFERRPYSQRPPRYDYVLTARGRDFFPVVSAMLAWGNRHLAPEGPSVVLAGRDSGRPVEPVVLDGPSLTPVTLDTVILTAGPCASAGMIERLNSFKASRPTTLSTGPGA